MLDKNTYLMTMAFIEENEGRSNVVYKCPAGARTIGVGHNIDANPLPEDMATYLERNGEITDEMVERLLVDDIKIAVSDCERLYPEFLSFTSRRQCALIDFLFNVGYSTAKTFIRTNRAINSGDWLDAATFMSQSLWFKQVKKRGIKVTNMIAEG